MVTKIHFNNTWRNFNPRKAPSSFRELRAFLIWNEGRDCFSKSDGYVWKITTEGKWEKVCRNIGMLSFEEYLKLSLTI